MTTYANSIADWCSECKLIARAPELHGGAQCGLVAHTKDWLGRLVRNDKWRNWKFDFARVVLHPSFSPERATAAHIHTHIHTHSSCSLICHSISNFRCAELDSDVALVKLSRTAPHIARHIETLALPASGAQWPSERDACHVVGWGCTHDGAPASRMTLLTAVASSGGQFRLIL